MMMMKTGRISAAFPVFLLMAACGGSPSNRAVYPTFGPSEQAFFTLIASSPQVAESVFSAQATASHSYAITEHPEGLPTASNTVTQIHPGSYTLYYSEKTGGGSSCRIRKGRLDVAKKEIVLDSAYELVIEECPPKFLYDWSMSNDGLWVVTDVSNPNGQPACAVYLYDVSRGKEEIIESHDSGGDYVQFPAMSPSGDYFFYLKVRKTQNGDVGSLLLMPTENCSMGSCTSEELQKVSIMKNPGQSWSHSGKYFLLRGPSGSLCIKDVHNEGYECPVSMGYPFSLMSAYWSADDRMILFSKRNFLTRMTTKYIWNVERYLKDKTIEINYLKGDKYNNCKIILPDNQHIFCSTSTIICRETTHTIYISSIRQSENEYILNDPMEIESASDIRYIMATDQLYLAYWATGVDSISHAAEAEINCFVHLGDNSKTCNISGIKNAQLIKMTPSIE